MTAGNLFDRGAPAPDGWAPDPLEDLHDDDACVDLDFETTGLAWWGADRPVGVAVRVVRDGRPISKYHPFGHRGGGNLPEARVKAWFDRNMRAPAGRRRVVRALNGKFECHMSRVWGADLADPARGLTLADPAHAAALLDDRRVRFNLEELAQDALGIGKLEAPAWDMGRVADLAAWQVAAYAKRDVDLVGRLEDHYAPLLAAEDLLDLRALESDLLPMVAFMEGNGAPIDTGLLARYDDETKTALYDASYALWQESGAACNPGSADDMRALFARRGVPLPGVCQDCERIYLEIPPGGVCEDRQCRVPGGGPSVRASFGGEVLERVIQATGDKAIALALDVARLSSFRSKYVVKYIKAVDGRGIMRYGLHQLRAVKDDGGGAGTVSGRFSSAGLAAGVGINVQQVIAVDRQARTPQIARWPVRALFVADKGRRFFSADAEQIEYRVFAHFANSARILARYETEDPDDPATWINYHKEVQPLLEEVRPDIGYKRTKNTNFAKLFGAGLRKFAAMLAVTANEAIVINRAYDAQLPEAAEMMDLCMRTARDRGWVKTLGNLRARFPDGQRLHSAMNRVIQGSAAWINKLVMRDVWRERARFGFAPMMTVHDELNGQIDDPAKGPELQRFLNIQRVPLRLRILWKSAVGKNWAEVK